MKKLNILTYMIFALTLTCLLGGVSNSKAEDLNSRLIGTYAVNTVITCNYITQARTQTIHLQGLYTFYGDGSGDSEVTSLGINNYPPFPPTGSLLLEGSFTYTVYSDDYFTIEQGLSGSGVTITDIEQEGWIG